MLPYAGNDIEKVFGALEEWQQRYQAAITLALHDAESVPASWWPAMQPLYTRMFTPIVALTLQRYLTRGRWQMSFSVR